MNEGKNIYFANFNITFGNNEEPMLEHFMDIIYPAFCSNYKRAKEEKTPIFYFDDISIKEYNEELVMERTKINRRFSGNVRGNSGNYRQ